MRNRKTWTIGVFVFSLGILFQGVSFGTDQIATQPGGDYQAVVTYDGTTKPGTGSTTTATQGTDTNNLLGQVTMLTRGPATSRLAPPPQQTPIDPEEFIREAVQVITNAFGKTEAEATAKYLALLNAKLNSVATQLFQAESAAMAKFYKNKINAANNDRAEQNQLQSELNQKLTDLKAEQDQRKAAAPDIFPDMASGAGSMLWGSDQFKQSALLDVNNLLTKQQQERDALDPNATRGQIDALNRKQAGERAGLRRKLNVRARVWVTENKNWMDSELMGDITSALGMESSFKNFFDRNELCKKFNFEKVSSWYLFYYC